VSSCASSTRICVRGARQPCARSKNFRNGSDIRAMSAWCESKLPPRLQRSGDLVRWRPTQPPPGISSALARAKARRLEATLTYEEWDATLAFFCNRCAYCRGLWWMVDHVTPLERGGGTTHDNCLPACGSCNRYKGQRTLEELILRVQRRDAKGNREARLYKAVSLDNLSRALTYLHEKGRPPSEPIKPRPKWCGYRATCNLGHRHPCVLVFEHEGNHAVCSGGV
jgi:hypothetical protein